MISNGHFVPNNLRIIWVNKTSWVRMSCLASHSKTTLKLLPWDLRRGSDSLTLALTRVRFLVICIPLPLSRFQPLLTWLPSLALPFCFGFSLLVFFFYKSIMLPSGVTKHLLTSPFTIPPPKSYYSKFHVPDSVLVTGNVGTHHHTLSCPQWFCSQANHAGRSIPIRMISATIATCVWQWGESMNSVGRLGAVREAFPRKVILARFWRKHPKIGLGRRQGIWSCMIRCAKTQNCETMQHVWNNCGHIELSRNTVICRRKGE